MSIGFSRTCYIRIIASCVVSVTLIASGLTGSGDREFVIALIPDAQNYVDYAHQKAEGYPFDARDLFFEQMRYIADNAKSKGGEIAFVTAVGDIWQHQTSLIDSAYKAKGYKRVPNSALDDNYSPSPKTLSIEIPTARMGFQFLANIVPFSVVPGNHDYDAMWTHSSQPSTRQVKGAAGSWIYLLGGLSNFRSIFSDQSEFFRKKEWYVASHDGRADSAQIFSAGGYRFLHIGLQIDAPDASLEWAASVIKRYPRLPNNCVNS